MDFYSEASSRPFAHGQISWNTINSTVPGSDWFDTVADLLADSWNNFRGFSFFLADGDDSLEPCDFTISSKQKNMQHVVTVLWFVVEILKLTCHKD